jgi:hypothetical protein
LGAAGVLEKRRCFAFGESDERLDLSGRRHSSEMRGSSGNVKEGRTTGSRRMYAGQSKNLFGYMINNPKNVIVLK